MRTKEHNRNAMKTLEDYIQQHARHKADKVALRCGEASLPYGALWHAATERAAQLREEGLADSLSPLPNTQDIAFVVDYLAHHLVRKDVADVLLTTGSTGQQKAAMLSHEAIVANAENLIAAQGFTSQTTFVISGPLDHIGSLSKMWPVLLLGGTVVITQGLKDVNAFLTAFEQSDAPLATFLVPASIRILLQFASERLAALSGKIDFIETGAAPIAASDMERLSAILPSTRLYNTYASTETGIVATLDYTRELQLPPEQRVCTFRLMKHARMRITEEGNIACCGPMTMKGYLDRPDLTEQVLRGGEVHTADRAQWVDEEGGDAAHGPAPFRLGGRSDDIVNIGGFKVSPVEIESLVLALPEVQDCICVPYAHPIVGQALRLLVVMQQGQPLNKRSMVQYLKARLDSYKVPLDYQAVDKIQRTFNGKLDRKAYRDK